MKKTIAWLLSALVLAGGAIAASAEEGDVVNLTSLGEPIHQGDFHYNYWDVFDGSLSTCGSMVETGIGNWIGLKLDVPAVFSHVRIAAPDTDGDGTPDRVHALKGTYVEGSVDGETWEYLLDIDGLDTEDYMWTLEDGEDTHFTEYAEPSEKAYRYFRVYNNGSGTAMWSEVEFYGIPTGSAEAAEESSSHEGTKDGLTARLDVTEKEGGGEITVSLTNASPYISAVTVEIALPEGLSVEDGEGMQTIPLANGEAGTVTAKIRPSSVSDVSDGEETDRAAESEAENGMESEGKSNGWLLPVGIGAAVVVLAVVILLAAKKKKGAVSCILLCGILLGSFAIPTSAATTERSFTLTADFTYNGETYPIEVTVRYDYAFAETDAKETNGMKQFEITYFYGPHNAQMVDESFIQKIAEAGFTSIPLEYDNTELNKQALPLLRKYGLTCSALSDARISQVIGYDRTFSPDTPQEEVDRIIAEVVADYADYMDVIEGWLLQDEPCEARFEILGKVVAAFRKYSPDKMTMINLFPFHAGSEMLGTKTYTEYLDEFVKQCNPHYISYDHYHFLAGGFARAGFFANLEYVREKALETGIDPMIIVLLTQHYDYDNLTYSQLMWEVNTSLTYGMKRISYFTFILEQYLLDDGWTNACMSYMGEIYPHYYDVQKINQWLLPLGRELFDKNSTAVFHLMEKAYMLENECEAYTGYGDLGAAVGDEFLIGFFDDCSFMITNKKYVEGEEGKNTIELLDLKENLQYFDPTTSEWKDAEADGVAMKNENGNLTVTFEAGEGFLFRVNAE